MNPSGLCRTLAEPKSYGVEVTADLGPVLQSFHTHKTKDFLTEAGKVSNQKDSLARERSMLRLGQNRMIHVNLKNLVHFSFT